ncbi:LPS assembly protein LptD [Rhodanobacter sp. L36]|uniref:LPS-assembly protein LptD n=1 Tax=Rhodanobacter sp. L36 TaxID=1747221 RepID=UPI00131E10DB|nr:LPS assembly protein LptD [Rhodanobacter sp. L36]
MTSTFPPRRLLAVAAALALIGGQVDAKSGHPKPKSSLDGSEEACPLGSFHCAPRPYNFAICRPNALLEFYDPTLDKSPDLRDTSPTKLHQARTVDSSDQTVYHFEGDVKMSRADEQLQADTVDYNSDTTDYDARGHVRYQESSQLMAGSHMRGNSTAKRGIADNVRYQMLDSRGNGVAEQGQMFDAMHSRYSVATYSTCDVGHHVWEFHAKSITTNKDTGVGVARNATMWVGKVPFIYLPYMSFPLDKRRKSGFLFPLVGNTSRSGLELSTPYYFNIAPNYDATLDPRIYSSRGEMLAGEFRYLIPNSENQLNSSGQLNFEYVPNDHGKSDGLADTSGQNRYLIDFTDNTALWQSWRFTTSINRASDSSYVYDYGNALSNTQVYELASSAAIVGGGKWWNVAIGGTSYQNMNPFATDASLPYDELPYATLNLNVPISRWLEFGMDNEIGDFRKTGYVDGARADFYPYLQADFGSSAWFVRPKVAYRYTSYQLQDGYQNYGYTGVLPTGYATPFTDKSPSRALPIVSLDSGLIFDRSTSFFGNSYTQTLEPRIYYLYVPYRNQNNLPLFNTNLMSFDYWQLFSPNQFSGADRQMNANNLTGALTTRFLDENGVEKFSASFGQIRYFTPQKVQLPSSPDTVSPMTNWAGSDYVVQLDLQLSDAWRVNTTYQWSPNTHTTDVASFELQRRLGTDGILNFSYHYRRGLLEQYSASVVYPVSDRWRLIGSWTYAEPIKGVVSPLRGTVEALAGIEYDSCCVTLRLVDRNYVNQSYYGFGPVPANDSLRDNAVMFEVVFKGLGSSGGQIDPLLHRDILGYQ